MRRARFAVVVALASAAVAEPLTGCAPPIETAARAPLGHTNRAPSRLCHRELESLASDEPSSFSPVDAHPLLAAKLAKLAKRRVVLESRLPREYELVGLALPTSSAPVRLDAPANGAIGEVDGRGARGEVSVVVRAKRSGGLYDYVGDCEIVRESMELPPWDPRVPIQKKLDDLIVVVELADGRPMVHVSGLPPAEPRRLGFEEERFRD